MTTADELALLAAVRARPDDDLPRLVYADWLDEHGRPERAEFVRLQCELGRWPTQVHWPADIDAPADCEHCARNAALRRRERDLLLSLAGSFQPAPDWCVVTPPGYPRPDWPAWCVARRGFIESVACPAPLWLAHGDALLAAHPVRRVRPTTPLGGFEGDGERWRLDGDPAARTFTATEVSRASRLHDTLAMSLYRCRWPGVEFEFPPEERRRWAYEDSRARDAVGYRAAFEAGRRAATERNERVLRAIIGPPD